jgi:hypothetical protein
MSGLGSGSRRNKQRRFKRDVILDRADTPVRLGLKDLTDTDCSRKLACVATTIGKVPRLRSDLKSAERGDPTTSMPLVKGRPLFFLHEGQANHGFAMYAGG